MSSSSTAKQTATTSSVSPSRTPSLPVRIGFAKGPSFKSPIGFLDDGSPAEGCGYTVIQQEYGSNPCGKSFVVADKLTYIWNGCGGPTWVTWLDASAGGTANEDQHFGGCAEKNSTQNYSCEGGIVVYSGFLCVKGKPQGWIEVVGMTWADDMERIRSPLIHYYPGVEMTGSQQRGSGKSSVRRKGTM